MTGDERHYCVEIGPLTGPRQTRAAAQKDLLWADGQTIVVKFLGGSPALRARVSAVAAEWTAPTAANLHFAFVQEGRSDIRVAFVEGAGSWSRVGTSAGQVDRSEATMNFGWLDDYSTDAEVRQVVLHEFGHALGLIHEHQNPRHPIHWDRDAVLRDLSGPPNNWDAEKIQTNMFAKYDVDAVEATDTDPLSIMMYPIPQAWTSDGFSAGLNSALSARDLELIRKVYPRP